MEKSEYKVLNEIAEIARARQAGLCNSTLPVPYRKDKSIIEKFYKLLKKLLFRND